MAVRETIFLGSQGSLVRGLDPERRGDQRFSVVGGVLASRGPGFQLQEAAGGDAQRKPTPLVIRAFDTVFGRFQGAGIASILFSESPAASPRDRVDWLGQQNLFCGWKGYYASGPEQTLRVPSLAAFRSTWNGTDQNSREILASWPQPQHLGQAVPADLRPFVPGREPALVQAAAPRPFLGAKTLWTFPPPAVPATVDRPNLEAVWSLPGVIVLEGKSLILDSLDMIVNLRDLNAAQTSLFCCTGANLTVRNCTITLINPANQPFTLVRAEGTTTRGSRIRFEKTLIRGAVSSGFDLGKGSVDVAVRETIFLGSQGPLVRGLDPERRGDQRFSVVGGVLASRGPGFQLQEAAGGDAQRKPTPLVIRAFDTVFGRFQGAGIASILFSESPAASPRDRVDWLGQQNLFCGWKGYYASGPEQTLRVPSLAAFRSTWNGTDQNSREILASWPQPQHLGQAVPADLRPFVPGREPVLVQAAAPRPFLGAKTLWTFPPPAVPATVGRTGTGAPGCLDRALDPQLRIRNRRRDPALSPLKTTVGAVGPGNAGLLDLVFDTDSAQWQGDLGAFLREKMTDEVKHARVRVHGSGPRRSSPVRLRDGLVLEIRVEPPVNRDSEWLSWQPGAESRGRALFELHGGTLLLAHVRLRADESAAVDSLIDVEDGDLILHRCQLVAPAGTEARTPRLVAFSAASTRPRLTISHRGLFTSEPDRPVCIIQESTLITGGSAVQATLGRGLVALSQSALAAGTDAIEMIPAPVARGRFDADLVLDHCTLASEANIIRLGSWQGRDPGPDRPWLVTSRNCAFLGSYDRRVSETVLLRVDEEAMAHGTIFWQGSGDAVEVDAFTAAVDEPLLGRSRDVGFQWVNFWGSNHQTEITGPRSGSNLPSVRLWERLRPGRVEPSDLILDPNYHLGRPQLDVGADLSLQGISRRARPRAAGCRPSAASVRCVVEYSTHPTRCQIGSKSRGSISVPTTGGSFANLDGVPFTALSRRIIMTNGASGSSHSREGAWRRERATSTAWHRRADHGNDVAGSDGPALGSSWEWVSRTPCLRASLRGRDRRLGVRGLAALLPHGRSEWDLHLRAAHATHGVRRICAHDGAPATGSRQGPDRPTTSGRTG